jgi:hypothetical protein
MVDGIIPWMNDASATFPFQKLKLQQKWAVIAYGQSPNDSKIAGLCGPSGACGLPPLSHGQEPVPGRHPRSRDVDRAGCGCNGRSVRTGSGRAPSNSFSIMSLLKNLSDRWSPATIERRDFGRTIGLFETPASQLQWVDKGCISLTQPVGSIA